jgi:hypothetical protein
VKSLTHVALAATITFTACAAGAQQEPRKVDVHNFPRAETDMYFGGMVTDGGFGKLTHRRQLADIDKQDVVRMNRDTLYSSGVFDLDAGPVTVTLPDAGKRFMSMQVVNQDHYVVKVAYAPATLVLDRKAAGTRYMAILIRTLVNAGDAKDVTAANRLQDAIIVQQAATGRFEVPKWDKASQDRARSALAQLGSLGGGPDRFGSKDEVDPYDYLIGTAIGWGGNPRYAAEYVSFYPAKADGQIRYSLTVKDVPVDGFWSISVYNAKGYFEKNDANAYSLNNLTAKANPDGSYTIHFGGCDGSRSNCLPISAGWNYTARLYRPRKEILDSTWKFPEAQPVR